MCVKVKGALPANASPQQIRQLALQSQLLAQQRSKLTGQKVAQLGQVMVGLAFKVSFSYIFVEPGPIIVHR